jgi:capsid assembly protease
MSELRAYAPRGIVAIQQQAYGLEFPQATPASELLMLAPSVACVEICGPMVHGTDPHFRNYRSIVDEVRAACLAPGVETLVLKLNSPGGDVFGNFDASREIRAIATAAGKRLIAYSDAACCSAAYALACAADEIVIADTAVVGSVGVIAMLVDSTRLDGAMGLAYTVIKSGARKADGNPHAGTTDSAIEAMQATVDQTAAVFFSLVAERRGLTPETVAAYQAAVFVGANAVGVRFADSVESFSSFRDRLSGSRTPVRGTETSMADEDKDKPKEDAVRAALVTASESDDEEKASKAKRALAAYDDETAKAEDETPPKKDDDDSKASASLAQAVAPLAKQVAEQQAQLAALKAEADASKRASIFAARPDIKPELIKSLDATPTSALKAVLDAIPVTAGFQNPHVTVPATRPTVGANGGRPVMSANAELNDQMGLTKKTGGVTYEANSQVFGGSK